MSTSSRPFINEGILRIAIFVMFAAMIYTVQNYVWVVVVFALIGLYSLGTGIMMLTRKDKDSQPRNQSNPL